MKRFSLPKLLRIVAIIICVSDVFIGYDLGNKMVIIDRTVSYSFDIYAAVVFWFKSFALGLLFWSIGKIIELLE